MQCTERVQTARLPSPCLARGDVKTLTKPLLGLGSGVLDDLNNTSLQSLDGRDVVGEDTHVTSSSRDVDLRNALRRVEGLDQSVKTQNPTGTSCARPNPPDGAG